MIIYPVFFLSSLLGLFCIFWRHFSVARGLSSKEVKARLLASESVRKELELKFIIPAQIKFYEVYLPAFWRRAEKAVRRLRVLVLKFETKLSHLSDKLRGKHINLDISERSEYWQTLNGAKNGVKNNNQNNNQKEEKPE